jgi:AcrR family transcriptional regulator
MPSQTLSRGERTQADIVEVAYRHFLEKGFHGTSVRSIALDAGISLGGIYSHFESKEAIFQAVLYHYHPYNQIMPALNEATGATVEQFVQNAAHKLVDKLGNNSDVLNLMFIELVEFKGSHFPNLFEQYYPQFLVFLNRFSVGQTELRNIPLPILLRAFFGLFFSYYITDILFHRQFPAEMQTKSLDYFVDVFLRGILADQVR